MSPNVASTFVLLSGWTMISCGNHRLDFGQGAPGDPWPEPPRLQDGGIDESTPFVVAPHQYGAVALATDGARIYWSTGSYRNSNESELVRSCAIDDCRATLITYANSNSVGHTNWIAAAAGDVFWGMGIPVKCPIAGCAGLPTSIFLQGSSDSRFAVDDSYFYWTPGDGTVLRCPHSGCGSSPEFVTILPDNHVGMLVATSTEIFAATWDIFRSEAQIVGAPKDGSGTSRGVMIGVDEVTSMAVDASRVYFTTVSSGDVSVCPSAGGHDPTVFAAGGRHPVRVTVDDVNAYWIDPKDDTTLGQVYECSLSGCDVPKVLASDQHTRGAGLALDATHVYWTNEGPERSDNPAIGAYFDGDISRVGK